jgi:hypothetical protein
MVGFMGFSNFVITAYRKKEIKPTATSTVKLVWPFYWNLQHVSLSVCASLMPTFRVPFCRDEPALTLKTTRSSTVKTQYHEFYNLT